MANHSSQHKGKAPHTSAQDQNLAEQIRFQNDVPIGSLDTANVHKLSKHQRRQVDLVITVYPQFSQQDAYNFCVKYDFNHDAIEEALGNIIDDSRHSFDAEWNTVAKNSKKATEGTPVETVTAPQPVVAPARGRGGKSRGGRDRGNVTVASEVSEPVVTVVEIQKTEVIVVEASPESSPREFESSRGRGRGRGGLRGGRGGRGGKAPVIVVAAAATRPTSGKDRAQHRKENTEPQDVKAAFTGRSFANIVKSTTPAAKAAPVQEEKPVVHTQEHHDHHAHSQEQQRKHLEEHVQSSKSHEHVNHSQQRHFNHHTQTFEVSQPTRDAEDSLRATENELKKLQKQEQELAEQQKKEIERATTQLLLSLHAQQQAELAEKHVAAHTKPVPKPATINPASFWKKAAIANNAPTTTDIQSATNETVNPIVNPIPIPATGMFSSQHHELFAAPSNTNVDASSSVTAAQAQTTGQAQVTGQPQPHYPATTTTGQYPQVDATGQFAYGFPPYNSGYPYQMDFNDSRYQNYEMFAFQQQQMMAQQQGANPTTQGQRGGSSAGKNSGRGGRTNDRSYNQSERQQYAQSQNESRGGKIDSFPTASSSNAATNASSSAPAAQNVQAHGQPQQYMPQYAYGYQYYPQQYPGNFPRFYGAPGAPNMYYPAGFPRFDEHGAPIDPAQAVVPPVVDPTSTQTEQAAAFSHSSWNSSATSVPAESTSSKTTDKGAQIPHGQPHQQYGWNTYPQPFYSHNQANYEQPRNWNYPQQQ